MQQDGVTPGVCGPLSARALSETGYVESQNVMVKYHWLEGEYDRVPNWSGVAWR
jgi:hypothetical protein